MHSLFEGSPARAWREGEPRTSRMVFIGRELDAELLREGFKDCLAERVQVIPRWMQHTGYSGSMLGACWVRGGFEGLPRCSRAGRSHRSTLVYSSLEHLLLSSWPPAFGGECRRC